MTKPQLVKVEAYLYVIQHIEYTYKANMAYRARFIYNARQRGAECARSPALDRRTAYVCQRSDHRLRLVIPPRRTRLLLIYNFHRSYVIFQPISAMRSVSFFVISARFHLPEA